MVFTFHGSGNNTYGILRVEAETFAKYQSFVLTAQDSNNYRDYKIVKPGYDADFFEFLIPAINKGVNQVWIFGFVESAQAICSCKNFCLYCGGCLTCKEKSCGNCACFICDNRICTLGITSLNWSNNNSGSSAIVEIGLNVPAGASFGPFTLRHNTNYLAPAAFNKAILNSVPVTAGNNSKNMSRIYTIDEVNVAGRGKEYSVRIALLIDKKWVVYKADLGTENPGGNRSFAEKPLLMKVLSR